MRSSARRTVSSEAIKRPSPGNTADDVGAAAFIFQDTALRYVNPAAEVMTGYSRQELLAQPFWAIIHPEDRELVRQRGLARQRGETVPWHYEVRIQRKDGGVRVVEFSAGTIDYGGGPAVLGTAIDVTERRASEEHLRESERRFRTLTDSSSDIVLVADADGRMRYLGAAIERLLGFRPDELVGHDGLERMHRDDRERVRAAYADLARRPGGRVTAVYRVRHRDGSWRWLESIGTNLLDDPAVRGIIINSRDVTDREEAIAGYRAVVEHSLQGLVIVQDGRIVFANRSAMDVVGPAAVELIASGVQAARTVLHPDDAPFVMEKWRRRLAGEPTSPSTEFRIVRPDGSVRWIETYTTAIEYRGRPAQQVAYLDVTERKRAEDEARRHQQDLAHVLRRRTMGEMAAVFAHEVNQPLTAIVSYAKGCAHRLRTESGPHEQLLGALDEIAAQAVRAGEIIRRLRRFVGRGEAQRQPRQLNELVDEAVRFVLGEARENGVRVQLELTPQLPPLDLDAVQIEQTVLNLVRNALDAMRESPGTPAELTVRTRRAGGEVEVVVVDSGPGLAAEIAGTIFEPFVTSKREGLGMGLSICRSIVDAHGGRIWAAPNAERGMTFAFALPIPAGRADG